MSFPFYKQHDSSDCGPTCLKMISQFYGKTISLETIKEKSHINTQGVSFYSLILIAKEFGLNAEGIEVSCENITESLLPAILHFKNNHFVVLYKLNRNHFYVADPAVGKKKIARDKLKDFIPDEKNNNARLLAFNVTEEFSSLPVKTKSLNIKFLYSQWLNRWHLLRQVLIGMLLVTLISLITPMLTQIMVDDGILKKDSSLVTLILFGQLALYLGQMIITFLRSWIVLHMSTQINISIVSNFIIKLFSLPLSFFESRKIGDIIQRIGDHHRIENFLTTTALNTFTSLILLFSFSIVLSFYNTNIFLLFIATSIIYILWIVYFLKKRKLYDDERFQINTKVQGSIIQFISGIHDIKYNNCEKEKRWAYERIQSLLYKLNVKSLKLTQVQQSGALLINQVKSLVITYYCATLVISDSMTLGAMLAIQFIIGQLNNPLDQLVFFIQSGQDAKLSFQRLSEIHNSKDEITDKNSIITELDDYYGDLRLQNISFRYAPHLPETLKNINLNIPFGKITAIVGSSGSGKTTILKLLLKNFLAETGDISLGNMDFNQIKPSYWRTQCGVVMQDGFIFSDSVKMNVAMSSERVDEELLKYAYKIANLENFIANLPNGDETLIGQEGSQISQGEKQRLLIARAIYKMPKFIFLDEATNSLDVTNEGIILSNLNTFFRGRTVVIVAHRLSTVKDADQIIVLDKGTIKEIGTHQALLNNRHYYFNLVSNQLNLC